MSRRCPSCAAKPAWHLSDGRWKCRRCGHRYRYRVVWDAQRISGRDKTRLLEFFVLGVPAYRLRFRLALAPSTIERFYRLTRAALAIEQLATLSVATSSGTADSRLLRLGVCLEDGCARLLDPAGVPLGADVVRPQAIMEFRNDRISIQRRDLSGTTGRPGDGLENFWSFVNHWLHSYRGVPPKNLPPYLGEICFRFNHREQDLFPLVNKLLRRTPLQDVMPAIGPDSP